MVSKAKSSILTDLYYLFAYPYLKYCSGVWANTHTTKLECLNVTERKIIRIIYNLEPFSNTDKYVQILTILICVFLCTNSLNQLCLNHLKMVLK